MTLKFLIQKEFIQIRRNPFVPKLLVVFPIMIICVMPWVMNMEVKNIRVDIVDNDRSTQSQRLTESLRASSYFILNAQRGTYAEALRDIESGEADIILTIPQEPLKGGVEISANAANATKGAMGTAYLTQILTTQRPPSRPPIMGEAPSPLWGRGTGWGSLRVLNLYNRNLNYKVFMIPALMGVLVLLLCGFLPAMNIVGEKESGTIEQINVTPVSRVQFILGKLIPYWIIAMLVMTICLLLSWAVYGIVCQGNLLLAYLTAMLLALVFSGLGLIVSNYSATMQQATFVMWFIVIILMLLSGMFTPVGSMPRWAQHIAEANPMHYFIDAMRTVFVRGGTLRSIAPNLLALSIFALAMDIWAVVSYRKNSK